MNEGSKIFIDRGSHSDTIPLPINSPGGNIVASRVHTVALSGPIWKIASNKVSGITGLLNSFTSPQARSQSDRHFIYTASCVNTTPSSLRWHQGNNKA